MIYRTNQYVHWSLLSGIFAAICWCIGDMLLVGFAVNPNDYPLFAETYASQVDVELATYMLTGSTQRLQWGAMLAVASLPFYAYALFAVWQLIKPTAKKYGVALILLWIVSLCFHPIGHAGFYYVGEIYKAILATDSSAHATLLETAKGFEQILMINWMMAMGSLAAVYIFWAVLVYRRQTLLPRWAVWINPVLFSILIILIAKLLPQPLQSWVGAATFNEANLIFWIFLYFYVRRQRIDFIDYS
ncbi:DUF6796 family protein [Psychrobacter sp. I-STPA10]|uniref:DUF6796 family protein n=1 Tax=Psychrobacter sp. I-STPA10 TaxID=2585769 RepID=UPI001E5FDF13|nr:DUF6796 family protein [Psychrobacter sp. I-STPA10]